MMSSAGTLACSRRAAGRSVGRVEGTDGENMADGFLRKKMTGRMGKKRGGLLHSTGQAAEKTVNGG
jgi:hypothetical protein